MAKSGKFNYEDLTVKFGGELSKPHNIFTAQAMKVPTYTYKRRERESLGNGWYGSGYDEWMETVDNLYVIIKDGVCIGQMIPYHSSMNIKADLNGCNKEALKFLKEQGIEYQPSEGKKVF